MSFRLENPRHLAELTSRYACYLSESAPELEVEVGFRQTLSSGPLVAASADELRLDSARAVGSIRFDQGRGAVQLLEPEAIESFGLFFRLLYTALAQRSGRTFVHASAAERGGKAYLFTGPSGAGKTTAVRMLRGVRVIHDDTVFLEDQNGRPLVQTTPFMGADDFLHSERRAFPVAGVFLLCQDTRAFLRPVSAARALGRLLTLPWPEIGRPPRDGFVDYVRASLHRCSRLVESARCFEMHFSLKELPEGLLEACA